MSFLKEDKKMKCPYCKSTDVVTYYEAEMPNILSACPKTILGQVKIFPFKAQLCPACLLGFNTTKLNDDELSLIYDNYLYISPMRNIGNTKYTGMIETLKKYYCKDDKLVEIGCSEGYLLNMLKKEGYTDLTGIEPGPQADQARKLGLRVINSYFNKDTPIGGTVDGFFLMHVFEHFSDPFAILRAMKKQLSSSGKLIIEVPYFSGYHHQHLFFYNLIFLRKLCADNDMKIVDINVNDEILRVVITHLTDKTYKEAAIAENPDKIKALASNLNNSFKSETSRLCDLLLEHTTVFWWGAGSSSVIFLNQIPKDILNKIDLTVIDGDENKWQKYIPGLNVKVQSFDVLKGKSVDLVIIASQLHKEIITTIRENNISVKKIEVFV